MTTEAAVRVENSRDGSWSLADAHAWCRRYTKERAKNFYYAFAILPEDKRHAIYAAYAFSGLVDDIADELQDRGQQEQRLGEARARLHACATGDRSGPLFTALGWALDEFQIPIDLFNELVTGVEMDFTINRYASWADLYQYCYRVASMVGLICTSVFGTRAQTRAREYAIDLGVALQIVNIMRDVAEDAARGRVYFPEEDLQVQGLCAEDVIVGRYDARFAAVMKQQAARAHLYFRSGSHLLPLLDLRARMCVNVLQGIYADILRRIEFRNYDVISERVSLSSADKFAAIGRLWAEAMLVRPK